MNDDLLTIYNGIEVYKNDIEILVNQYESQFSNIDSIKTNSSFFTGLVIYINRNLFKNIRDLKHQNDYNALNNIFYDCYIPLCMRYDKTPTLQSFCIMVGINNTTLSSILTGYYSDGSKVNKATFETVQKWKHTTESALIDAGMTGNPVFSIFALKANHGWRETTPAPVPQQTETFSTPEQIAEKYRDIEKPELPEIV